MTKERIASTINIFPQNNNLFQILMHFPMALFSVDENPEDMEVSFEFQTRADCTEGADMGKTYSTLYWYFFVIAGKPSYSPPSGNYK